MKKVLSYVLTVVIALAAVAGIVVAVRALNNGKAPQENDGATASKKAVVEAFVAEAKERVDNVGKATYIKSNISLSSLISDYPKKFDLREADKNGDGVTENYVTSVKYQNPFGTCWAFGAISAAETSILYELGQEAVVENEDGTLSDTLNLSEHHTGWFAYTPLPEDDEQAGEGLFSQVEGVDENPSLRLNSGSTQYAASQLFAAGMGPVIEPDFDSAQAPESQLNYHGTNKKSDVNPNSGSEYYSLEDDWSVDESQRFRQSYMLNDTYFLLSPVYIDKNGYNVKYADMVIASYKEQVFNGRPISISYHADNFMPFKVNKAAKYINNETWGHYCYENVRSNHVVTIIGWDDNYPKENFLTEIKETNEKGELVTNEDGTPKIKKVSQPPKDGAWIVKNSWGATNSWGEGLNTNGWGDNGYFYLSYYDQSIETAQCFDFDVKNELKQSLGKYILEEYDFMPCEVPRSIMTDFPVTTANVFNAEENETIKAVSCITTQNNEEVMIMIYKFEGDEMILLGTTTVNFEKSGLHVVNLPKDYPVKKGDKIAIALAQQSNGKYIISIGSEYNQKGFDAGFCDDKYAANGVVNKEESYIYLPEQDELIDLRDVLDEIGTLDGPTSYLTYDNFPIKAYASIDE